MRHFLLLFLITSSFTFLSAQDILPKEFHAGRREALRELMPANSVAVIFSAPVRKYANDVDYVFHQNPDMYYFSGYKEPDGVLFIFKEPVSVNGKMAREVLFVQKKNRQMEQWNGVRLGREAAMDSLGIELAFNGDEFKSTGIDFTKYEKIIIDRFTNDNENTRNNADLFDLIRIFREKAGIDEEYLKNDKFSGNLYRKFTGLLREIKTPEEMYLLRKAVEISCIGQLEVMKALKPDMSEREIQGLHEYVHKKYGAEHIGYPSIVGAGNNGCILHYIDNNKARIGNHLLLMDVGAEYRGYTADVTRTIPANGKFSPEQKIIYNLVYDAQEAAFKLAREGVAWMELEAAARNVISEGLVKLGIAKNKSEANKYYPHGLGHHIGLDVHDRNSTSTLKKNMVVTIEPGIYIPDSSDCDKKWWGIAVRIEDDILINEKDFELLSDAAPRTVEGIEKAMREKSPLDQFILPKLKSDKKGF